MQIHKILHETWQRTSKLWCRSQNNTIHGLHGQLQSKRSRKYRFIKLFLCFNFTLLTIVTEKSSRFNELFDKVIGKNQNIDIPQRSGIFYLKQLVFIVSQVPQMRPMLPKAQIKFNNLVYNIVKKSDETISRHLKHLKYNDGKYTIRENGKHRNFFTSKQ